MKTDPGKKEYSQDSSVSTIDPGKEKSKIQKPSERVTRFRKTQRGKQRPKKKIGTNEGVFAAAVSLQLAMRQRQSGAPGVPLRKDPLRRSSEFGYGGRNLPGAQLRQARCWLPGCGWLWVGICMMCRDKFWASGRIGPGMAVAQSRRLENPCFLALEQFLQFVAIIHRTIVTCINMEFVTLA